VDDTLPSDSFFSFCDELLDRYNSNPSIVHIGGVNFLASSNSSRESYCFSIYNLGWGGWATWRRAWSSYNFALVDHPDPEMERIVQSICHSKNEVAYWHRMFRNVQNGVIDAWDYQWTYACWKQRGLSIIPRVSLIKNLGFRNDATHSLTAHPLEKKVVNQEMTVIHHPSEIQRNKRLDRRIYRAFYRNSTWSFSSLMQTIVWQLYIVYRFLKKAFLP
jgi:hypothetical protein